MNVGHLDQVAAYIAVFTNKTKIILIFDGRQDLVG